MFTAAVMSGQHPNRRASPEIAIREGLALVVLTGLSATNFAKVVPRTVDRGH
jgi:hypothetical protein